MKINLKLNRKKLIPLIIYSVLILLCAIFVIRVAVWEKSYYDSEVGSVRAEAESTAVEEEEVSEEEPTEEEIAEYTVPADQPRYLAIESIGLTRSRIISVGLTSGGAIATSNNIFDVGWYNGSGKPGASKAIVLDGHNGGPTKIGVFKYLPVVEIGAEIKIETGDGTVYTYEVVKNLELPLTKSEDSDSTITANTYMATAMKGLSTTEIAAANPNLDPSAQQLTIITCTGEWSDTQKTYLSRQFLHAILVSVTPAA